MELNIVHLYPEEMSLYGDRGNILTLMKRCDWRGIKSTLTPVRVGDGLDLSRADILFMGGGQDRGQKRVAPDLGKRKIVIKKAVEHGLTTLLICGGYQLFGRYFKTVTGEIITGIDVLDVWTVAGNKRQIGNVLVDVRETSKEWPKQMATLTGFENHSGQTYLGHRVKPLGKTSRGQGNNMQGGVEGAVYKNCYGTYLHGSLLPKNPAFADHLINLALSRKYGERIELPELDDSLETLAHDAALTLSR